jgi:hypothetical protein
MCPKGCLGIGASASARRSGPAPRYSPCAAGGVDLPRKKLDPAAQEKSSVDASGIYAKNWERSDGGCAFLRCRKSGQVNQNSGVWGSDDMGELELLGASTSPAAPSPLHPDDRPQPPVGLHVPPSLFASVAVVMCDVVTVFIDRLRILKM